MTFSTLSSLADLVQLGTLLGMGAMMLWDRSRVTVVARSLEDGTRLLLGRLERRTVSRAELLGMVAQCAHGERLDFSAWRYHPPLLGEVVVDLPAESFQKVAAAVGEGARAAS